MRNLLTRGASSNNAAVRFVPVCLLIAQTTDQVNETSTSLRNVMDGALSRPYSWHRRQLPDWENLLHSELNDLSISAPKGCSRPLIVDLPVA